MKFIYIFILSFFLFLITGKAQNKQPFFLDKNGALHHELFLENNQQTVTFEVCGFETDQRYMLQAFADNRNTLCSYRISIDNQTGNSFVGKSRCNIVSVSKENGCISTSNMVIFQIYPIQKQSKERSSVLTFDESFAAQHLVTHLFAGTIDIDESSISTSGAIAKFENGSTNIGLDEGIIIANAPINQLSGTNTITGAGGELSPSLSDVDLDQLVYNKSKDCSLVEFDFTATSPSIHFDYIFASEEYCDYIDSPFSDAVGIFLSGDKINGPYSNKGINLAILPEETRDSITSPIVNIRNINHIRNTQFYRDNNIQGTSDGCNYLDQGAPTETQFDGFTTTLTAKYDNLYYW